MTTTTLCYIENEGKYLMLHRVKKKNDINEGKWIGVGGHVEYQESPEECLVREVKEETGLTLTKYRLRAVITFLSDKWETEYMHIFHSDAFTGEIKECDEGTLEWIDKQELYSKPIWEGDKIFLRLLEKPTPFFSLKLQYIGDTLVNSVLHFAEQKEEIL